MLQTQEQVTFSVPLTAKAHQIADKFCQKQSNGWKAEQVYLNTLAVYAVNYYLQCLGFETELAASDSWDPIMQAFLNVADLQVKNCGKLECRVIMPGDEFVSIPEEVRSERVGYVAVQLDQLLEEATVLGFVKQVTSSELPLEQLRSLEELPEYLSNLKPLANLSQWFENVFETGWQSLDTLLGTQPELAWSFRSAPGLKMYKLMELEGTDQSVALIVAVNRASQPEMDISVEVRPVEGQIHLPANLKLMVLDEEGETVMNAQAQSENKNIKLELSGEPGDQFSIKLALGEVSVTEDFVI